MATSGPLQKEERVLILAPIGQDAKLASEVLARAGFHSEVAINLVQLCALLGEGAGLIMIAEEALDTENSELLRDCLARQKSWSDIPVLLMTSSKGRIFLGEELLELFAPAGNISILERPFHTFTLVTAVRVALRARNRQYQVRDLLQQMEVAVKQRDEFLSVASHELKTPLTSLKLQVQMRKRKIKKADPAIYRPESVNSLIEIAENQVNRLNRLVDDMLDISRIENGKLALNTESVELGELIHDVVKGFQEQIPAHAAEVKVEIKNQVRGKWDRYRIEQVVTNLLTNAVKYGDGKPITITVRSKGRQALLEVHDQGMGIAPEHCERIFQRFERAVSGVGISGLGLGLYITREIIELHGGKISVNSEVGKGSTFIVELPAEKQKNTSHGLTRSSAQSLKRVAR